VKTLFQRRKTNRTKNKISIKIDNFFAMRQKSKTGGIFIISYLKRRLDILRLKLKFLKVGSRKKQVIVLAVLILAVGTFVFFKTRTGATTYQWLQATWSGGADTVNFPNHVSNQSGWTKYYSKDSQTDTSNNEIKITQTSGNWADNFSGGTPDSNTYVSGGLLNLKKNNGVTCSADNNCSSGNCRKDIASSTYYCAVAGRQCGQAGGAGYITGDASGAWLCAGQDTGYQCSVSTQCDEYGGKYCNGAGTWVVGSSNGVNAACSGGATCGGTVALNEGDLRCVGWAYAGYYWYSGDTGQCCSSVCSSRGGTFNGVVLLKSVQTTVCQHFVPTYSITTWVDSTNPFVYPPQTKCQIDTNEGYAHNYASQSCGSAPYYLCPCAN
jgi:hypothetical protein